MTNQKQKEFYDILNINQTDTPDTIKKAFRKNIKKLHPDHGGNDITAFTKLKQAYDILIDPTKKSLYDNDMPIDDENTTYKIDKLLAQFFTIYFDEPNPVQTIKDELNSTIIKVKAKIDITQININTFQSILDTVYRKDNKENLFNTIVNQKIRSALI